MPFGLLVTRLKLEQAVLIRRGGGYKFTWEYPDKLAVEIFVHENHSGSWYPMCSYIGPLPTNLSEILNFCVFADCHDFVGIYTCIP